AAMGVPVGLGGLVWWGLAALGLLTHAAAAPTTYSMNPQMIEGLLDMTYQATTPEAINAVRDASIEPGLESIAPGLGDELAPLANDLWRGVDAVHFGARPLFSAFRAQPRPADRPVLNAWLAVNCLRELLGDNHWALCAAEDLDAIEVGLLHSAMIDPDEYESEEWIARSRGNDDAAIATGWARLEAKGLATGTVLNDAGRTFRRELERRTDALTAPAWEAAGETTTERLCTAVETHDAAFLARINATAGPKWMPAIRHTPD
ncbi:MAG: hypothetical protein AAFY28_18450, partial [Actinomycetota bacterium]